MNSLGEQLKQETSGLTGQNNGKASNVHVILTELCLGLETISKMRLPSRSLQTFSQLFHQIYAYIFLYIFLSLLMEEMPSVLQAGHSCPPLQYNQLFCRN